MNIFQSLIKKKAILDSLRPLTQGEILRLREEFILQNTYNSNAIEGNTLTMGETALILEGVTIDKKPLKEHLEAVGHKDALNLIDILICWEKENDRGHKATDKRYESWWSTTRV